MSWKSGYNLPSTLFYFVADWHRTLAVRLHPMLTSPQSQSFLRGVIIRKNSSSVGSMQSFISMAHGHRLVARGEQTLRYRCAKPFSRPSFTPSNVPCSRGVSSGIFDEDLDMEFATERAEDESELKKGLRRPAVQSRYSVVDPFWAKAVVKKLKSVVNFQDKDVLIVECNPEHGLLTRALLMRTRVNVLCLHFRNRGICSGLEMLMKKRSLKRRLHVERGHIINVRTMLKKIGKLNSEKVKDHAHCIKILGTTFTQSLHSRFITLLCYDLGALNHIYSLGHLDIFLFVPESELRVLGKMGSDTLFNCGSLRSALYKVFFNVNVLLKIPDEAFQVSGNHSDHYLIHLVPRPDIYEICTPQNIPHLILLLKELRKRRGQRVISAIQSFCSPTVTALEELGFTETDNISNLSVEQVIRIHQVVLARPDCLPLDLHDETEAGYLP
ncbi:hypothetical protein LSH36_191g02013 [Paralvinella palmiformis]|uniref:rRNA adenine N(6)-methyltransferase n=1 Tax=Paralvinella palmiformis TaxID=53620 RepID=A0AAD9N5F5_9ANNE|nr:hypothetical protein LSH36_191g02013 [Paralvinella palmiformis]